MVMIDNAVYTHFVKCACGYKGYAEEYDIIRKYFATCPLCGSQMYVEHLETPVKKVFVQIEKGGEK